MITTDYANWQQVNRHMIAKILSELEYERTLHAELHGETGRITLPGAVYTLTASGVSGVGYILILPRCAVRVCRSPLTTCCANWRSC